ncbi:ABC transporter permease [Janthinobacterium sp. 17J80-10]|uniref:ABC transporter permease n=1 Tax=Janthinobacterium sp. 17J80-10 TaxID=2497863 RepID=UPI0010059981|nr:ABC transporter permease [Janthinobacterium sp. 17J80-10]QAU35531.1 ABC transporter permease [Janthinobacterium sp. 17J80-10]
MNNLNQTPLRKAFAIQFRVVHALLLRELITRYGRHNIGFMWLFVEPMLFTAGVAALWAATRSAHGSTLPIIPFAVTGYSSVLLWRNAANRCANAIQPNLSLLYHRNVRVLDVFASRLLLEIAGATISLIMLSIFFIATGMMKMPEDLLLMACAWLLLAWFAVALGLVVGAITERSEIYERLWHTLTYLMFPLSGAVFMVDWLPQAVQNVVLWIPMVHGTEMLRHGYFGEAVQTHENPAYLITASLVMTLLGLALMRETARRVEPA